MKKSCNNGFPKWGGFTMASLVIVLVVSILMLRDRFFSNENLFVWLLSGVGLLAIYECFTIFVVNKSMASENPRRQLNVYLATKVGRIFLALLYAVVYLFAVKQEIKIFVLVFVLIYFVYLLFDTLLLTSWEKEMKKK